MDQHLHSVSNGETKLRIEVLPSDVRKVIIGEEEQQEWSSSLDQEDPEPPHIKEEQEELWTSQEGEQLQGLEEADITKFPFTPVPVKSEDEEEKPQSSQLHQSPTEENREAEPLTSSSTQHMETEADGDECGGSEPASNSDPPLQTEDEEMSDSNGTDDSDEDWIEPSDLRSGLNSFRSTEVPVCKRYNTGGKSTTCSECGKTFTSKSSLNWHKKIHTGEKPFACSVCNRSFTQRHTLVQHMRTHTGMKPFVCSVCGKRFGQSSDLKKHMRVHTGEKPFCCSICSKRFTQHPDLVAHLRIHTGEKPFSCKVCKKSFRISGNFSRHMRIHSGKKTFKSYLDHTSDLNIHTAAARRSDPDDQLQSVLQHESSQCETNPSESWKESRGPQSGPKPLEEDNVSIRDYAGKKPLSCPECGGVFCRRDHLMNNMRTHTGEKLFSCSVCQKHFSFSGTIMAHMRVHTGEKPFDCPFCGKSFNQNGTLQLHTRSFTRRRQVTVHMSVHTEERRVSCSVCHNRFSSSSQFKTHECVGKASNICQSLTKKSVTAKTSFNCPDCRKTFSLKGNLKKHMIIHSGEKPYTCSVCCKSFKQNVHLTKHVTTHKLEKLYTCSICGEGFNTKSLVENHNCVSMSDTFHISASS